jgi:hypothetical protein
MKKFLLFGTLVLCLNVAAYDTGGRFGMGIRFWGTPLITFADVKIDVNNAIGFEPSIGFYNIGDGGSSSFFITSLLMDIKPVRAERANLLFKFGGLFADSEYSNVFAILFGLGIEHFVNDNFAINAGILAGYVNESAEGYYDYSVNYMSFGTQIADFSLTWYLK